MHDGFCQISKFVHTELPAIFYERKHGAASRPVPQGYCRREPEKTALHVIVRENLETLFEEARLRDDSGTGYPQFVEHEFRRYLDCGILSRGFARLRCPSCGFERLVAFSCKGRFCPSCWSRRTADIAAHLVDRVFPEAQYRQWVLTFPWQLRFLLAVDRKFLSEMLQVFLRTVFAWQRLRGRRLGLRDGETGSVTFVQRFGGILNLNPHFHTIIPDGLFVPSPAGNLIFTPLPPPQNSDIQKLALCLSERFGTIAKRRLEQASEQTDHYKDDQTLIYTSTGEALHLPLHTLPDPHVNEEVKPLCAKVNGFTLHAARIVEKKDRSGLERLCRYGLRAPLSLNRISLDTNGQVHYRLHRPWPTPNGKSEIVLEPLAFLRRLTALLPAPYINLVRYHGIFSNRSRFRNLIPLPPQSIKTDKFLASLTESVHTDSQSVSAANNEMKQFQMNTHIPQIRQRRLAWAQLLRRVLHVDALICARCTTPMLVLAFITDQKVLKKILDHLGLPSVSPPIAPARIHADKQFFFNNGFPDKSQPAYSGVFNNNFQTARSPP